MAGDGSLVGLAAALVVVALAGACDKREPREPPGRPQAVEGGAPAAVAPVTPAPIPVLTRLAGFTTKAQQSGDTVAEVEALIAEGTALVDEAHRARGDEIVQQPAFKDATASLVALNEKRLLLTCAARPTAKEVSACVDGLVRDLAASTWPAQVTTCRQALGAGLSTAIDYVSTFEACRAATPDYGARLALVLRTSPALASENATTWTKQREKALATMWNAFGKSDVARGYWQAAGAALHDLCAGVDDGDFDPGAVLAVDGVVKALGGGPALRRLPATSYRLLLKDREAEKGKVLKVRAQVLS
ncbi:MAG: hypothetical protein KC464_27085, partial [Myxococcales bacterium]|nr:hypothetical protein [Myxococcales bacterium]